MAFCERCGSELNDETELCAACGAAISAAEENPYAPPKHSAIGRTEKRRKSLWSYFIGAFKKYAVFKGRVRRAEFWGFLLFYMIFNYGISILEMFFGLLIPGWDFAVLSLVFRLGTFIPHLSVTARRMHDCDKSGWYMLIPIYGWPILCCTEGTRGSNYYGPDPKDENADEE